VRRLPPSPWFAGLALLTGCAAGPNFQRPAPPAVTAYTPVPLPDPAVAEGASQRFAMGAPVAARWWTLFHSPELDALEDQALSGNSDLKSARAALRSLDELYRAQRAARLPDVQLAASAQVARTPNSLAPIVNSNAQNYALYNVGVNISYAFDVFGGVKRATEAAAAQAENQRYLAAGVYLTLTANVAATAVQIASLNTQLDAAKAIVAADRRTLDIIQRQQRLGEASSLDVANAESTLEQAGQLAPPLQKQIDQERDLLATLTGRPPSEVQVSTLRLTDFTLPVDLPVSLPSDLVRRRPDVKAAEANIHFASAEVGVAAAARLPSFLITAGPGVTATNIGGLFTPGNAFYSLTGGVTQTIFDAGALKHRKRSADALLEQAEAQYRGVVLAALQSTADTLQAIVDDAATLQHAAATEVATARAVELARSQLARGQAGSLQVLSAEAADGQTEIALVQARAARYADTVALYQTLGGGWRAAQ
jgi:NodT family efflux transporter outer membrane factor (OMF) lipoprotein